MKKRDVYYFPDSILREELYFGLYMIECLCVMAYYIVLMFMIIFINWRLVLLVPPPLLYIVLNHKSSYNDSIWIGIKKRRKYSSEPRGIHYHLGGVDEEKFEEEE